MGGRWESSGADVGGAAWTRCVAHEGREGFKQVKSLTLSRIRDPGCRWQVDRNA